jgi:hypothetical protein
MDVAGEMTADLDHSRGKSYIRYFVEPLRYPTGQLHRRVFKRDFNFIRFEELNIVDSTKVTKVE